VRPEGAAADGDSYAIHHTILVITISCEGQTWTRRKNAAERERNETRVCGPRAPLPTATPPRAIPETATRAPECSNVLARKMLGDLRRATRGQFGDLPQKGAHAPECSNVFAQKIFGDLRKTTQRGVATYTKRGPRQPRARPSARTSLRGRCWAT